MGVQVEVTSHRFSVLPAEFRWRVLDDDQVVMQSLHAYPNRVDCWGAGEQMAQQYRDDRARLLGV